MPSQKEVRGSTASVARDILRSFESIRIELMVDVGDEAPSGKHNIRLGDVVIGYPVEKEGDVHPYNFAKAVQDREFERTGSVDLPPTVLLTALTKMNTDHERTGSHIAESVRLMMTNNPRLRRNYQHPGAEHDRLYESSYTHRGDDDGYEIGCDSTSPPLLRRTRCKLDPDEPVVHYGLIASADKLMKDAIAQDRVIKERDILCFEMEVAGLMNDFPCVAIRGICDDSDSHENDAWQEHGLIRT